MVINHWSMWFEFIFNDWQSIEERTVVDTGVPNLEICDNNKQVNLTSGLV